MSKSKAFFLLGFSLTLLGLAILARLFANFETPVPAEEWRAIVVQWVAAASASLASFGAYALSKRFRQRS